MTTDNTTETAATSNSFVENSPIPRSPDAGAAEAPVTKESEINSVEKKLTPAEKAKRTRQLKKVAAEKLHEEEEQRRTEGKGDEASKLGKKRKRTAARNADGFPATWGGKKGRTRVA
jgi:hypothetical protein